MSTKSNACRSGSGCIEAAGASFLGFLARRRFSPRTVEVYGQGLRDFGRFIQAAGTRRVQQVTSAHLLAYRQHLRVRGFSPASEGVYLRAVKRLFDHLTERQLVFGSPFDGADPIRHRRRLMPVPTEAEVQALLAAPDVGIPLGLRARAILEVAYGTGARLEEIARMKRADMDLAEGVVRIMGKGAKERVVPLGASAVEWLRRYLAAAPCRPDGVEALWVKEGGLPLGSRAIGLAIHKLSLQAGGPTPITPHAIRRACATHMLRRGASPVQLQALLGHASLRHLSAYLRVSFLELKTQHDRSRLGR